MPNKPEIAHRKDFTKYSGRRVVAIGRYRAIPLPRKGPPDTSAPKDRAVLVLADGTMVFLEPLDSGASRRTAKERNKFDGKRVRVTGIAHKAMPSRGQSPTNPCLCNVTRVMRDQRF